MDPQPPRGRPSTAKSGHVSQSLSRASYSRRRPMALRGIASAALKDPRHVWESAVDLPDPVGTIPTSSHTKNSSAPPHSHSLHPRSDTNRRGGGPRQVGSGVSGSVQLPLQASIIRGHVGSGSVGSRGGSGGGRLSGAGGHANNSGRARPSRSHHNTSSPLGLDTYRYATHTSGRLGPVRPWRSGADSEKVRSRRPKITRVRPAAHSPPASQSPSSPPAQGGVDGTRGKPHNMPMVSPAHVVGGRLDGGKPSGSPVRWAGGRMDEFAHPPRTPKSAPIAPPQDWRQVLSGPGDGQQGTSAAGVHTHTHAQSSVDEEKAAARPASPSFEFRVSKRARPRARDTAEVQLPASSQTSEGPTSNFVISRKPGQERTSGGRTSGRVASPLAASPRGGSINASARSDGPEVNVRNTHTHSSGGGGGDGPRNLASMMTALQQISASAAQPSTPSTQPAPTDGPVTEALVASVKQSGPRMFAAGQGAQIGAARLPPDPLYVLGFPNAPKRKPADPKSAPPRLPQTQSAELDEYARVLRNAQQTLLQIKTAVLGDAATEDEAAAKAREEKQAVRVAVLQEIKDNRSNANVSISGRLLEFGTEIRAFLRDPDCPLYKRSLPSQPVPDMHPSPTDLDVDSLLAAPDLLQSCHDDVQKLHELWRGATVFSLAAEHACIRNIPLCLNPPLHRYLGVILLHLYGSGTQVSSFRQLRELVREEHVRVLAAMMEFVFFMWGRGGMRGLLRAPIEKSLLLNRATEPDDLIVPLHAKTFAAGLDGSEQVPPPPLLPGSPRPTVVDGANVIVSPLSGRMFTIGGTARNPAGRRRDSVSSGEGGLTRRSSSRRRQSVTSSDPRPAPPTAHPHPSNLHTPHHSSYDLPADCEIAQDDYSDEELRALTAGAEGNTGGSGGAVAGGGIAGEPTVGGGAEQKHGRPAAMVRSSMCFVLPYTASISGTFGSLENLLYVRTVSSRSGSETEAAGGRWKVCSMLRGEFPPYTRCQFKAPAVVHSVAPGLYKMPLCVFDAVINPVTKVVDAQNRESYVPRAAHRVRYSGVPAEQVRSYLSGMGMRSADDVDGPEFGAVYRALGAPPSDGLVTVPLGSTDRFNMSLVCSLYRLFQLMRVTTAVCANEDAAETGGCSRQFKLVLDIRVVDEREVRNDGDKEGGAHSADSVRIRQQKRASSRYPGMYYDPRSDVEDKNIFVYFVAVDYTDLERMFWDTLAGSVALTFVRGSCDLSRQFASFDQLVKYVSSTFTANIGAKYFDRAGNQRSREEREASQRELLQEFFRIRGAEARSSAEGSVDHTLAAAEMLGEEKKGDSAHTASAVLLRRWTGKVSAMTMHDGLFGKWMGYDLRRLPVYTKRHVATAPRSGPFLVDTTQDDIFCLRSRLFGAKFRTVVANFRRFLDVQTAVSKVPSGVGRNGRKQRPQSPGSLPLGLSGIDGQSERTAGQLSWPSFIHIFQLPEIVQVRYANSLVEWFNEALWQMQISWDERVQEVDPQDHFGSLLQLHEDGRAAQIQRTERLRQGLPPEEYTSPGPFSMFLAWCTDMWANRERDNDKQLPLRGNFYQLMLGDEAKDTHHRTKFLPDQLQPELQQDPRYLQWLSAFQAVDQHNSAFNTPCYVFIYKMATMLFAIGLNRHDNSLCWSQSPWACSDHLTHRASGKQPLSATVGLKSIASTLNDFATQHQHFVTETNSFLRSGSCVYIYCDELFTVRDAPHGRHSQDFYSFVDQHRVGVYRYFLEPKCITPFWFGDDDDGTVPTSGPIKTGTHNIDPTYWLISTSLEGISGVLREYEDQQTPPDSDDACHDNASDEWLHSVRGVRKSGVYFSLLCLEFTMCLGRRMRFEMLEGGHVTPKPPLVAQFPAHSSSIDSTFNAQVGSVAHSSGLLLSNAMASQLRGRVTAKDIERYTTQWSRRVYSSDLCVLDPYLRWLFMYGHNPLWRQCSPLPGSDKDTGSRKHSEPCMCPDGFHEYLERLVPHRHRTGRRSGWLKAGGPQSAFDPVFMRRVKSVDRGRKSTSAERDSDQARFQEMLARGWKERWDWGAAAGDGMRSWTNAPRSSGSARCPLTELFPIGNILALRQMLDLCFMGRNVSRRGQLQPVLDWCLGESVASRSDFQEVRVLQECFMMLGGWSRFVSTTADQQDAYEIVQAREHSSQEYLFPWRRQRPAGQSIKVLFSDPAKQTSLGIDNVVRGASLDPQASGAVSELGSGLEQSDGSDSDDMASGLPAAVFKNLEDGRSLKECLRMGRRITNNAHHFRFYREMTAAVHCSDKFIRTRMLSGSLSDMASVSLKSPALRSYLRNAFRARLSAGHVHTMYSIINRKSDFSGRYMWPVSADGWAVVSQLIRGQKLDQGDAILRAVQRKSSRFHSYALWPSLFERDPQLLLVHLRYMRVLSRSILSRGKGVEYVVRRRQGGSLNGPRTPAGGPSKNLRLLSAFSSFKDFSLVLSQVKRRYDAMLVLLEGFLFGALTHGRFRILKTMWMPVLEGGRAASRDLPSQTFAGLWRSFCFNFSLNWHAREHVTPRDPGTRPLTQVRRRRLELAKQRSLVRIFEQCARGILPAPSSLLARQVNVAPASSPQGVAGASSERAQATDPGASRPGPPSDEVGDGRSVSDTDQSSKAGAAMVRFCLVVYRMYLSLLLRCVVVWGGWGHFTLEAVLCACKLKASMLAKTGAHSSVLPENKHAGHSGTPPMGASTEVRALFDSPQELIRFLQTMRAVAPSVVTRRLGDAVPEEVDVDGDGVPDTPVPMGFDDWKGPEAAEEKQQQDATQLTFSVSDRVVPRVLFPVMTFFARQYLSCSNRFRKKTQCYDRDELFWSRSCACEPIDKAQRRSCAFCSINGLCRPMKARRATVPAAFASYLRMFSGPEGRQPLVRARRHSDGWRSSDESDASLSSAAPHVVDSADDSKSQSDTPHWRSGVDTDDVVYARSIADLSPATTVERPPARRIGMRVHSPVRSFDPGLSVVPPPPPSPPRFSPVARAMGRGRGSTGRATRQAKASPFFCMGQNSSRKSAAVSKQLSVVSLCTYALFLVSSPCVRSRHNISDSGWDDTSVPPSALGSPIVGRFGGGDFERPSFFKLSDRIKPRRGPRVRFQAQPPAPPPRPPQLAVDALPDLESHPPPTPPLLEVPVSVRGNNSSARSSSRLSTEDELSTDDGLPDNDEDSDLSTEPDTVSESDSPVPTASAARRDENADGGREAPSTRSAQPASSSHEFSSSGTGESSRAFGGDWSAGLDRSASRSYGGDGGAEDEGGRYRSSSRKPRKKKKKKKRSAHFGVEEEDEAPQFVDVTMGSDVPAWILEADSLVLPPSLSIKHPLDRRKRPEELEEPVSPRDRLPLRAGSRERRWRTDRARLLRIRRQEIAGDNAERVCVWHRFLVYFRNRSFGDDCAQLSDGIAHSHLLRFLAANNPLRGGDPGRMTLDADLSQRNTYGLQSVTESRLECVQQLCARLLVSYSDFLTELDEGARVLKSKVGTACTVWDAVFYLLASASVTVSPTLVTPGGGIQNQLYGVTRHSAAGVEFACPMPSILNYILEQVPVSAERPNPRAAGRALNLHWASRELWKSLFARALQSQARACRHILLLRSPEERATPLFPLQPPAFTAADGLFLFPYASRTNDSDPLVLTLQGAIHPKFMLWLLGAADGLCHGSFNVFTVSDAFAGEPEGARGSPMKTTMSLAVSILRFLVQSGLYIPNFVDYHHYEADPSVAQNGPPHYMKDLPLPAAVLVELVYCIYHGYFDYSLIIPTVDWWRAQLAEEQPAPSPQRSRLRTCSSAAAVRRLERKRPTVMRAPFVNLLPFDSMFSAYATAIASKYGPGNRPPPHMRRQLTRLHELVVAVRSVPETLRAAERLLVQSGFGRRLWALVVASTMGVQRVRSDQLRFVPIGALMKLLYVSGAGPFLVLALGYLAVRYDGVSRAPTEAREFGDEPGVTQRSAELFEGFEDCWDTLCDMCSSAYVDMLVVAQRLGNMKKR